MKAKPRIGFFSFASCEGCQLAVLECENDLLAVLSHFEIVRFREAASFEGHEIGEIQLDVAFVEGSITRETDADQLREIRRRSDLLIALGACAATAGLNALKNLRPQAEVRAEVYGNWSDWFQTFQARPISAVVPVDHVLRGCPIDRTEFLRLLTFLSRDLPLPVPRRPVCAECKARNTVCLMVIGEPCLGPVTACGCGAICTERGQGCEGCRGLLAGANLQGLTQAFIRLGRTREELLERLNLFNAWAMRTQEM